MKKFLIILAALSALLCSCNKEATTPEPEMVNVTFDYKMVESGSLTRSDAGTAAINTIKSLLPAEVWVKITSLDNASERTVKVGDTVSLPVGSYKAYYLRSAGGSNMYRLPTILIDETFIVNKNTTSITFNATYNNHVLVFDLSECKDVMHGTLTLLDKCEIAEDRYLIVCQIGSLNINITTYEDSEFIDTSVSVNYSYVVNADAMSSIDVQYGKYYYIHPMKAGTVYTGISYQGLSNGGSNI